MAWKKLGVIALKELTYSYIEHMWKTVEEAGVKRTDVNLSNLHKLDADFKAKGVSINLTCIYCRTLGIQDFHIFLQSYLYAHNSRGHCKRNPDDCTPSRFYLSFFGDKSIR